MILASASPRRAELLRAAGYSFTVIPSAVPEVPHPRETAARFADRAASEKARDVALRLNQGLVLGADTVVVTGGAILGKPRDARDARRMLQLLSGRTHRVVTGVALWRAGGGLVESGVSITHVTFRKLSRAEIEWYVDCGEPLDKAGAYGIQEKAGLFVTAIRGSYSNVVGLPLELVYGMLGLPA